MAGPRLILDYASPRSQSKLRMTARSTLKITQDHGEFRVVETLRAGFISACFGLLVAAFSLLVVGAILCSVIFHRLYTGPGGGTMLTALIVMPLTELALAAAVVQQTFRRTTLVATVAGLQLSLWSVFRRRRCTWTAAEVSNVSVVITEATDAGRLGELVIDLFDDGTIRLFTDHRVSGLSEISSSIRSVTGWNQR